MTKITLDDKEYTVKDIKYKTTDDPYCMFMDFICEGDEIIRYETRFDEGELAFLVVGEPSIVKKSHYFDIETEEFPF